MVSDKDRMWMRGKHEEEEEVKNNKINVYTDGHALKYKINAEVFNNGYGVWLCTFYCDYFIS